MDLGNYVKSLREDETMVKSATLEYVSKESGVSLSTLHNIERGTVKNPGVDTLRKIAGFYKVPLGNLTDLVGE